MLDALSLRNQLIVDTCCCIFPFGMFLDFHCTDFSCYAGSDVRLDGEDVVVDSVRQKVR